MSSSLDVILGGFLRHKIIISLASTGIQDEGNKLGAIIITMRQPAGLAHCKTKVSRGL